MADPVTASIQIALSAIKTGAAVAQWWETRQAGRTRDAAAEGVSTGYYRQSPEDLLYVMATMGQWLFSLDVVNPSALPEACMATRRAFEAGDPEDDDLGYLYRSMDSLLQYAVTVGMVFCAECWPMHMWKGFGCGVFNELTWANPNHSNVYCLELDNSIAALKSQPRPWQLLKKSPSAISKTDPETVPSTKSESKKQSSFLKDVFQTLEKQGFPQPLAPYDHLKISHWWIPFATWNGSSMYENEFHRHNAICMYQPDPGRYFWAWTAGRHSNLSPGEALYLPGEHIGALAQWLQGLNGITFRVIQDDQVDWSKIKFSRSVRNTLMKMYGNEYGVNRTPFFIVYDPQLEGRVNYAAQQQIASEFQALQLRSMPPPAVQTAAPTSPGTPGSPINFAGGGGVSFPESPVRRRRPIPMPPAEPVRTVMATHDFAKVSDEELSFAKGDIIEVIDDKSEDGWWKARIGDKTGLIPNTFVKDVPRASPQDTPQSPRSSVFSAGSSNTDPVTPATVMSDEGSPYSEKKDYLSHTKSITRRPVSTQEARPVVSPTNTMVCNDSNFSQQAEAAPVPELRQLETPRSSWVPTSAESTTGYGTNGPTVVHEVLERSRRPYGNTSGNASMSNSPQASAQAAKPPAPTPPPASAPAQVLGPWNMGITQEYQREPGVISTINAHTKTVTSVAFSPDTALLASSSEDKDVRLWDPSTGRILSTLFGHKDQVTDIAFDPNISILASASSDRSVKLWDVRARSAMQSLQLPSLAKSVAVSPDGKSLAVGLVNNKIQIWDKRALSCLQEVKGHKGIVNCVSFSPNGGVLASGSNDKTVKTWNPASGQPLLSIKAQSGMLNYTMGVAFSPDGRFIASCAFDEKVKVWDASSGAHIFTVKAGTLLYDVTYSPDGGTIVAGGMNGKVFMWRSDGTELPTMVLHKKNTTSVALSADGMLLATGSEDKTIVVSKL